MNEPFAQLVSPIFQYVIDAQRRIDGGETPTIEEVKIELQSLFTDAERKAAASRDLAADFSLAKVALVYWADEMLITSKWTNSEAWRNNILEWDYYRENLAGEKFFDKIQEAERLASTDPLETFFLCLALGFQGRLAINHRQLQLQAERAYGRVAAASAHSERFLPDAPEDANRQSLKPLPAKSVLLAVSIATSATLLFTLLAFFLAESLAY